MAIASMACTHHQDELPVWTHPWVCISENHRFDQPALWLWVNEILLDSSNEALILDCCVMPVARMDDPVSAQLRETIELQDGPSFVASKVRFRGDVLCIGYLLSAQVVSNLHRAPISASRCQQSQHIFSLFTGLPRGTRALDDLATCSRRACPADIRSHC